MRTPNPAFERMRRYGASCSASLGAVHRSTSTVGVIFRRRRATSPTSSLGQRDMANHTPPHLLGLIDRGRAESEQSYCYDDLDRCNLCGADLARLGYVIDGEVKGTPQVAVPDGTTMGQWAYMCPTCFAKRGVGVKWGSGQLYERQNDGQWLLVGGFQARLGDDA